MDQFLEIAGFLFLVGLLVIGIVVGVQYLSDKHVDSERDKDVGTMYDTSRASEVFHYVCGSPVRRWATMGEIKNQSNGTICFADSATGNLVLISGDVTSRYKTVGKNYFE